MVAAFAAAPRQWKEGGFERGIQVAERRSEKPVAIGAIAATVAVVAHLY